MKAKAPWSTESTAVQYLCRVVHKGWDCNKDLKLFKLNYVMLKFGHQPLIKCFKCILNDLV